MQQPDEYTQAHNTGPIHATRQATHSSSHPAPPSSAAMRALFMLELKFAALRDRLYIERMEETAEEEEMILNGESARRFYET